MIYSFELGPIRPPSEAYSLLLRATRNCPWNKCKFCHNYKGEKFQLRPVDEIKQDILTAKLIRDRIVEFSQKQSYGRADQIAAEYLDDLASQSFHNVALWLRGGGETVFLQDANSLIMRTNELVEILKLLKQTFPTINRITSYARSDTASKKKPEELRELHGAGLSRLHVGLESGYDPVLEFMNKGVTATEHIAGGKKIVESGISLCEYVVLGLGGKEMGREHAIQTAKVLNEINPDFIRVRTLSVNKRMPLYDEVENSRFIRATDEEIIAQERLMLENLKCQSNFVSDHITNLLQELEGKLPDDKQKMVASIDRFLSLTPEEKTNFKVGRRAGIYRSLEDLRDAYRHEVAEAAVQRLSYDKKEVEEKAIFAMMEWFV